MKRSAVLIILGCLFLFSSAQAVDPELLSRNPGFDRSMYVPGELLVKFKSGVRVQSGDFYRGQFRVTAVRTFESLNIQHLRLPAGLTVEEAAAIFRSDPDVVFAEPNYYRHAFLSPQDSYYSLLWGLHNTGQEVNGTSGTADADIDAPETWNITTGGAAVIVAVIDTGVDYNHPDLAASVMAGYDYVDDDDDPMDYHGHGTHVAGIIAAVGNNSLGVTGVCWNVRILPIRALNTVGTGNDADIISGIDYARTHGADIINLSLGGTAGDGSALKAAIDLCDQADILVVCAAGNNAGDNDVTPVWPASCDSANIIAVAASNQNDALASFSNYGASSVDVAAPGVNILSLIPAREIVWSDNFDAVGRGVFGNWTSGGTQDHWRMDNETVYSPSNALTNSQAGSDLYAQGTDSYIRSSAGFSLTGLVGARLDFYLNGASETDEDKLYLQTSINGTDWTDEWDTSGSTLSQWEFRSVDLKSLEGQAANYFGWRFQDDGDATVDLGWFIDDMAVSVQSAVFTGSEYSYMQGTSMAAPMVAGVAALIKTHSPGLLDTELKAAIEGNVDLVTALNGKVASGGRVNAYQALELEPAPTSLTATVFSQTRIDLAWTDNCGGEAGFRIERGPAVGGGRAARDFTQIAQVASNVTNYTDTGVDTSLNAYAYRVYAYKSDGSGYYSDYSSQATTNIVSIDDGGDTGEDPAEMENDCFISTVLPGKKWSRNSR